MYIEAQEVQQPRETIKKKIMRKKSESGKRRGDKDTHLKLHDACVCVSGTNGSFGLVLLGNELYYCGALLPSINHRFTKLVAMTLNLQNAILYLSLTHTHDLALVGSLACSLARARALSLSLTHSRSLFLSPTITLSHFLSLPGSLSRAHCLCLYIYRYMYICIYVSRCVWISI